MRDIRYFGKLVDPAIYRRGFGFYGYLAFGLNLIRSWLEKKIALCILRIEMRQAGLTPAEQNLVVQQAAQHSDFVPVLQPEVPRFVRKLMRDKKADTRTADEITRDRYQEGRKNSEPLRPVPFEEGMKGTFAQFIQRQDRSARYVGGRKTLIDQDALIVPVPGRRKRERRRTEEPSPDTDGD